MNFGFDKLRFITPVPSGKRVRGRFTLAEMTERSPEHYLFRHAVAVEIEGGDRLALAGHWLSIVQAVPENPS